MQAIYFDYFIAYTLYIPRCSIKINTMLLMAQYPVQEYLNIHYIILILQDITENLLITPQPLLSDVPPLKTNASAKLS